MHESIIEHVYLERGASMSAKEQNNQPTRHEITSCFNHIETQLEELLHLVGDRKEPATEDEIMNYVIGMIESVRIKRDKLTNIWRGF